MPGMRLMLGCLALLVAVNVTAQVYRWTDEQGRVVYGNEPPADAKKTVVQDRINSYIDSYSGPPKVQRVSARRAAAPAAGAIPVVLYATAWCPHCAEARAYFAKNRISYIEHDVEKNPSAYAEYKRLGGRGVPFIVHGSNVMRGFSENSFQALLARNGR